MLEIAGFGGRPVPNTFMRQDGETGHLGVILPGLRYRPNMPGLYYPALHLRTIGADVLTVDYRYDQQPDLATMPDTERRAWWLADATWRRLNAGIIPAFLRPDNHRREIPGHGHHGTASGR